MFSLKFVIFLRIAAALLGAAAAQSVKKITRGHQTERQVLGE